MTRSYNTDEIDDDELEAELDLLGDDLLMDNEPTYLEAVPAIPAFVPENNNANESNLGEKPIGA